MKSLVPPEIFIEKKILTIRGMKVILDKDLAEIYGVKTSRLNEQVRRNINRFPPDFMFQLTKEEMENWKSQIAISKSVTMGLRKRPYAFTEHGAVQAANVLNSDRAVEMGVAVVRAFVRMRELIIAHKDLAVRLDELEKKYDTRFKFVFDAIKKLIDSPAPPTKPIGFLSDEQKKAVGQGRVAVKEGGLVYVNSLKLSGHEDVAGIFYDLKNQDREKFVTLMLNKDDEILGCEVVSVGTLDSALVHPREVLKIPVNIAAAKIALVHNHPSGDHVPSDADIKLTKRLSIAAKIVGIEVLYHVVVGRDKYSVFNDVLDNSGHLLKAPEVYPIIRYESRAHPADKPLSLKPIKSPADVVEFARPLFDKDEPLAMAVFLDTRKNVASVQILGSQYDEGWVGRLARAGIAANAAGYIICSNFDISNEKLKALQNSGEVMGIPLLDCVVLDKDNKSEYISSKKRDGVVNEITNKTMSEGVTEISDSAPKAQEGKGMMKVAERAAKGTYVARITGVDDHLNVQREFLKTELTFGKAEVKFGDRKGGAEVFIDPETLKEGDIISMKVVRAAGDKPEEKFYKIVSDPGKSRELHNVVKKIPGGKEEVAKMLLRNTLVEGRKFTGSKNLLVAVDVSADKKSYAAKIVGADEKFGFKREFIGEHKELAGGAGPGQKLEVSGDNVKAGDIIAVKIVKEGEDPKAAKEVFYRVEKDPSTALELREVARKISREDAAKAVGAEIKTVGRMNNEDVIQIRRANASASALASALLVESPTPDKPVESGKRPGLTVVSDIQKGAYVAKLTGPDEKFGFKREFIGKKVWDEEKKWGLAVMPEDIPNGTVIAAKSAGGKDVKETYYLVVQDAAVGADKVLEKITKERAVELVTGKSKTPEDVKKTPEG
ncbi:MAG: hypothetical protein CVT48_01070 [Thermoplasmata archaeon HGW-Thermoplasmata-1]|nr:MAG: hypothetical protein CVT48_01070 [Thermoplasmata archaeon HGW-Thermoplasmata-1]